MKADLREIKAVLRACAPMLLSLSANPSLLLTPRTTDMSDLASLMAPHVAELMHRGDHHDNVLELRERALEASGAYAAMPTTAGRGC
jgi:hypothetical protein